MVSFGRIGMAAALALAAAGCGGSNSGSGGATGDSAADTGAMNAAVAGNVAAGGDATAAGGGAATGAPGAMTPQAFADTAAASDMFEIQSSELARRVSKAKPITSYADQMIADHTKSSAALKAATAGASPAVTPAAALPPAMQERLTAMQGLTGKAFDQRYVQEQVASHQATLTALQAYAANGTDPALKAHAAATAPVVQGHLAMAQALKP